MPSSQLSCLGTTVTPALGRIGHGTTLRTVSAQLCALKTIYSRWIKLDPVQLSAALTVFSAIVAASTTAKHLATKISSWSTKFFTTSVTVPGWDRLNGEVRSWLESNVLMPRVQRSRELLAYTESEIDYQSARMATQVEITEKFPIKIMPFFGTRWFILHGQVFIVRENGSGIKSSDHSAPNYPHDLTIKCLGFSMEPIRKFLGTCHDFSENKKATFTMIYSSKGGKGDQCSSIIMKPIRDMGTIYFDESVKTDLIADIQNYLDPDNRKFYAKRGIPYRRGYLLHGPPGTGKSSLSAALAGQFGLDLFLVHMPTVRSDRFLESIFSNLPQKCIVLLEDIDAVGLKRSSGGENDEDDDDDDDGRDAPTRTSKCTLSGLLNVLDGVSSQTGRIVLMTSNFPEKLDEALIRPGRIDKQVYLGRISQSTATTMFLAIYASDDETASSTIDSDHDKELAKHAAKFSSQIPENTLTPAEIQGYLIKYRDSPEEAANGVRAWIEGEEKTKEEAA